MPTDNKQPQSSSLPPVPTDDMSPLVVEDTNPPMLNDNDLPVVNTPPTVAVEEKPSETASGSAAPSDDVVMAPIVTTQKKKFAGGKVIATILGLFLLVGGVGAGIVLVNQNQNISEKAAKGDFDQVDNADGHSDFGCECGVNQKGECKQCKGDSDEIDTGSNKVLCGGVECSAGQVCENSVCKTPKGDSDTLDSSGLLGSSCIGPEQCHTPYVCIGSSPSTAKCELPSVVTPVTANGITCDANTPGVPESIGVCCVPASTTSYNYVTGQPWNSVHWTTCANGYTCQQGRGCFPSGGGTTPPGDNPTTPPTTPAITASCQNVKAYSSTWTLLTNAQLAALKPTNTVNFCVAGVATGGSFNKARFTINGVQQAETTTVRPSSTDFCQSYVIPAGVTTFNVTAQINHVTLGWK